MSDATQSGQQLAAIICLLLDRRLGKAIDSLENYLLAWPRQADMERLNAIKADYQLMADYWQRGYDDPLREQVYNQLLRRMYELTAAIAGSREQAASPFMTATRQRPRNSRNDWTPAAIRTALENYVSEQAMLSLEEGEARRQRSDDLHRRHWDFMRDVFDYILTTRQWREGLAEAYTDMLLSPTLDSADQQLIVSAITLSALQRFCFQKFCVLMNAYLRTTDERLRQRALVGWVLTADASVLPLYPEMRQMIADACADERCRSELTELQMQLYYCMDADADTHKIREEILPDIMNGSNLKMTSKGLVEMDEDSLDDILHPEAAEQNMERMEQSMKRMADMQRQGADVYFGGFSQMKRFPFFSDVSSWFVPFYGEHPAVSAIWNGQKGHRFLQLITRMGAFCDSDKYSFVLAFDQVLGRLPASMLKMIEEGEATPMPIGGQVDDEEQQKPAFMRRMYLQDMYRFYRLYTARGEFRNPFGLMPGKAFGRYLFFASPLYRGTALEQQFVSVAGFLAKRRRYADATRVLDNVLLENHTYEYYMLETTILLQQPASPAAVAKAVESSQSALQMRPDSQRALACTAKALFAAQRHQEALDVYNRLLQLQPENKSWQLHAAVCLTSLDRADDALKLLYKLSYLYADDETVSRVLAWALTLAGRYDQAAKIYLQLTDREQPEAEDLLNHGYQLWFEGKLHDAAAQFRRLVALKHDDEFSLDREFLTNEHALLNAHGISDMEILLMLDFIQSNHQ